MASKASFPDVRRIIADSDLDGMCAAVVLKKAYPYAEVHFAHAALIRSGILDDLIDDQTVTVDLPFHPKSGWYLDHHLTNKPTDETVNTNRWQTKAPSQSQALFTREERRRISRSEHLKSISHKQIQEFLADKYLDEEAFRQLSTLLEAYDYIVVPFNKPIGNCKSNSSTCSSYKDSFFLHFYLSAPLSCN